MLIDLLVANLIIINSSFSPCLSSSMQPNFYGRVTNTMRLLRICATVAFLLLLPPMSDGFAPIVRASTPKAIAAAATAMTAIKTRPAIKTATTTKLFSVTRSDEEGKDDAEEKTANDDVAMALAVMEHFRTGFEELCQKMEQAFREKIKRNHEIEVWKESNPNYLEDERLKSQYQDKKQDLEKANELLKKARDRMYMADKRLEKARDLYLVVAKILVPVNEYEPLSKETALTFDLERYRAGEWISLEALRFMTDLPTQCFIRKASIDIFGLLKRRTTQIVLVGSPGVGKSLLLVLYAFWNSFHESKNVVLIRKIKGDSGSLFIFLLQGQGPQKLQKWRVDDIEYVRDILSLIQQSGISNYELCLDGINQSDLPLGSFENFPCLLHLPIFK